MDDDEVQIPKTKAAPVYFTSRPSLSINRGYTLHTVLLSAVNLIKSAIDARREKEEEEEAEKRCGGRKIEGEGEGAL